jgi:hypothetical protein
MEDVGFLPKAASHYGGMSLSGLSWRGNYQRAYAHYYWRSHVHLSPNVRLRSLESLSSECTTFSIFITDPSLS